MLRLAVISNKTDRHTSAKSRSVVLQRKQKLRADRGGMRGVEYYYIMVKLYHGIVIIW